MMTLKDFTDLPIGIVGKAELMVMPSKQGEKVYYRQYETIRDALREYGNYALMQIFDGINAIEYVIFDRKKK